MGGIVDAVFGGNDAPPAPDYTGAAEATAKGNLDAARATAAANRTNQITPYGNLTYTANPGTDAYGNTLYTATESMSFKSTISTSNITRIINTICKI